LAERLTDDVNNNSVLHLFM